MKRIFGGSHQAFICNECIVEFFNLLEREEENRKQKDVRSHLPKPQEIAQFLNQYVISQEKAKMALSVALYNHYKRISYPKHHHIELEKSNILLLGPSGSGKTLLAKTLARVLNIPFAMSDATALTEAGYVGEDVESILSRLLHAASFDIEKAQKGIVYIDEIDKIAKKGESVQSGRDIGGEGVQQGLLKILEGASVYVPLKGARKNSNTETVLFDTKDVLFICGGAFVGIKEERGEKRSGFLASSPSSPTQRTLRKQLLSYGMIPEFIGRIPLILELEPLSLESLVKILKEPKEPKDSIIAQYQYLFSLDGVKLEFTDEALLAIAQKALDEELGARGLRHILEEILMPLLFEIPSKEEVTQVSITQGFVLGNSEALILEPRREDG